VLSNSSPMGRTNLSGDDPQHSATDEQLAASALLHDHATLIKNLSAPFRAVIDSIGTAPFEPQGSPRSKELLDAIRPQLVDLQSELRRMCPATDRGQNRSTARLQSRVQRLMKEPKGSALLPQAAACARDVLQRAAAGSRLCELASKIVRICAIADLLKAESQVVGMAEQTRILRDVLVATVASPEHARTVDFNLLVQRAIEVERQYAESLRIDFRRRRWPGGALLVKVQQSDVQRALINLLSNAVKYSYPLSGSLRAWISVDVYRVKGTIRAEFESWGVPIMPEDLGNGRLFTPRYRGGYALKLGKAGTGMGLWDARETARKNRGDVEIQSKPARRDAPFDDEPMPPAYLTTVTLSLPAIAG
jgi:signal transduction histidine kinase